MAKKKTRVSGAQLKNEGIYTYNLRAGGKWT